MGHITKRLGKELPEANPLVEEIESMIDFKARPEDIETEQFCDMAKLFCKHKIITLPLV
jgi:dimethyladenosine transferase 1